MVAAYEDTPILAAPASVASCRSDAFTNHCVTNYGPISSYVGVFWQILDRNLLVDSTVCSISGPEQSIMASASTVAKDSEGAATAEEDKQLVEKLITEPGLAVGSHRNSVFVSPFSCHKRRSTVEHVGACACAVSKFMCSPSVQLHAVRTVIWAAVEPIEGLTVRGCFAA